MYRGITDSVLLTKGRVNLYVYNFKFRKFRWSSNKFYSFICSLYHFSLIFLLVFSYFSLFSPHLSLFLLPFLFSLISLFSFSFLSSFFLSFSNFLSLFLSVFSSFFFSLLPFDFLFFPLPSFCVCLSIFFGKLYWKAPC